MRVQRVGKFAVVGLAVLGWTAQVEQVAAKKLPLAGTSALARFLEPFPAQAQEAPAKPAPVPAPKADDQPPAGPGDATAKRLCSTCHGINVWATQRHTREKWGSIIDNMISKGMEASDDDLATVNEYLATYLAAPPAKDAPPAQK